MLDINERMRDAYLEAVAFTDFGEEGQPPKDAEFSALAKSQAYIQCRNFLWANQDLLGDNTVESMAYDLWLTRNGHGTGFWDRPEKWGVENAETLTCCAKCMGSVDTYQGDDGLVYFS